MQKRLSFRIRNRLHSTLYALVLALFLVLPFSIAAANTLSGLILMVLVAKGIATRDISYLARIENLPIIALTVSGLLALTNAVDLHEGIVSFVSPIVKYAIVFLAVSECMKNTANQPRLLKVIFIGGIASSLYGLYQYFGLSMNRITSFLYNPNPAGSYLAICSLLSLSLFLATKKTLHRVVLALCTSLGIAATILTMSRGALIGFGAALLVLVLLLGTKLRIGKKALLGLLVIVLILPLLMPQQLIDRFVSITNLNDSSNKQRILLMRAGWEMFMKSPILGWGPGNFKVLYEQHRAPGAIHFPSPHNIYLLILVETGLLGLMSYVWLTVLLVRRSLSTIVRNQRDAQWVIALTMLLSGVVMSVHGLVDSTLAATQVGLLMCAFAAATASLGEQTLTERA